jgi:hypothetical protein
MNNCTKCGELWKDNTHVCNVERVRVLLRALRAIADIRANSNSDPDVMAAALDKAVGIAKAVV